MHLIDLFFCLFYRGDNRGTAKWSNTSESVIRMPSHWLTTLPGASNKSYVTSESRLGDPGLVSQAGQRWLSSGEQIHCVRFDSSRYALPRSRNSIWRCAGNELEWYMTVRVDTNVKGSRDDCSITIRETWACIRRAFSDRKVSCGQNVSGFLHCFLEQGPEGEAQLSRNWD